MQIDFESQYFDLVSNKNLYDAKFKLIPVW